MFWVFIITMMVLGLVAAANKIETLVPASKQLTDFLKQSEGWIGVVSVGLSIYWLIKTLMYLKFYFKYAFLKFIFVLVSIAIMFLLGMVLSQTLLKSWTGGNEKVNGVIDKVVGFATPFKEPLGLLAVVMALVNLGLAL
ncbi:hypothetical protein [Marinicella rhabdoformis]|uniref:hypothetical protein n=1 Tax=Marinicella rhabdoformis TaxID=2580566 RepID=UPI0012AED09D|nr:hypothetical protein [Marinicella rhabdoformis]